MGDYKALDAETRKGVISNREIVKEIEIAKRAVTIHEITRNIPKFLVLIRVIS